MYKINLGVLIWKVGGMVRKISEVHWKSRIDGMYDAYMYGFPLGSMVRWGAWVIDFNAMD